MLNKNFFKNIGLSLLLMGGVFLAGCKVSLNPADLLPKATPKPLKDGLVIPPDATSPSFLLGSWQTPEGSLENRQENQKIQDVYEFDHRGMGIFYIKDSVNGICKGQAIAKMKGQTLEINVYHTRCPNGIIYDDFISYCRNGAGGVAVCQSTHKHTGTTYSFQLQRIP